MNAKKTIKRKFLVRISLILTISLTVLGFCAYLYFSNILKNQSIKDDTIKLEQTVQQLEYIGDDIYKYSQVIVNDETIQEFVKKSFYNDALDEVFTKADVKNKLSNYTAMRDFINSIILITPQNDFVWSTVVDDSYIKKELNQSWYMRFKGNNLNSGFSSPHNIMTVRGENINVISYILKFKNSSSPNKITGTLIINIHKEYFDNIIKLGSKEYDDYAWVLGQSILLYSKNRDFNFDYVNRFIVNNGEKDIIGKDEFKVDDINGYYLLNKSSSYDWELISFTSNKSLYSKTKNVIYFFIAFVIVGFLLVQIFMIPMITNIVNPISKLSNAMRKVSQGDLNVSIHVLTNDELEIMSDSFNVMTQEIGDYIKQLVESENMKRKMEHGLLLSQINPHFIYNVLNSVIYIARKNKNEDIVNIVDSFIRILQDAVKIGEDGMFTTVEQEVSVVKYYLTIQCYRYPDQFDVFFEIDETLNTYIVPRTVIQPLVENAIIHGILVGEEKGRINIRIFKEQQEIHLQVEDNGIGMNSSKVDALLKRESILASGTSMRRIGISNIIDRLEFLYESKAKFSVKSTENQGTLIDITIPCKEI
jgi:two-component system sensor histidine kinase YesM